MWPAWSTPSTRSRGAAGGAGLDPLDGGVGVDGDAAPGELGMDQAAELGVDRGQHLGQCLDLGDGDAAPGEGFGHLQTHVAGADDQGRPGLVPGQGAVEGEGVAHGVDDVHPVGGAEPVEPVDRGQHRYRAGADDQGVVAQDMLGAVGLLDPDAAVGRVDLDGAGVQHEAHPGRLEIGEAAVRKLAPVRHLTGDVVGDPADREVRERVSDHHGHLDCRVQLPDPQSSRDAGIAATDDDDVHDRNLHRGESRWG